MSGVLQFLLGIGLLLVPSLQLCCIQSPSTIVVTVLLLCPCPWIKGTQETPAIHRGVLQLSLWRLEYQDDVFLVTFNNYYQVVLKSLWSDRTKP